MEAQFSALKIPKRQNHCNICLNHCIQTDWLVVSHSKFAVKMPNVCQGFLCGRSRSTGECGGWDCLLEKWVSEIFNYPALSSVPFPFCPLTSVNYIESGEAPTMGKGWRSGFCFRIGLKHTNALSVCQLKRCPVWELRVEFCLGQKEDCILGDSISDSSGRLLQRTSGGRSIYKIFEKGEFNAIKCLLYKRFSASHKELMSPWRDLVIF